MSRLRAAGWIVVTLALHACTRHVAPAGASPRPELYGAGLFSTSGWDFFLAFAPNDAQAFFCRANADFSAYRMLSTRRDADGHWTPPEDPSFAPGWGNADPHLAPDGGRIFFISNRPGPGESGPQATYDIWTASRRPDGGWSEAVRVGPPVSVSGVDEWSPSVAASGDLYFGTERAGGHGKMDLWVARPTAGGYGVPENLGDSINTAGDEVEPWVAPDESYLIFSAKGRADSVGHYDLYLSRRLHGTWQRATRIDAGVSSPVFDFNPSVSPDGRWLYFSSTRRLSGPLGERLDIPRDEEAVRGIGNGQGDIYRMALTALGIPGAGSTGAAP